MAQKEKTVRQVYSMSDIAFLAGTLVVGVILSFFVPILAGLGYTILFCWICTIPFWLHGYRIAGEEGMFTLKEILVARECKDEILAFLDGSSEKLEHNPRMNGGALVNVYTRRKDGRILAQYFDYADYAAGKEYELHQITPTQFTRLVEIDAQSKKGLF